MFVTRWTRKVSTLAAVVITLCFVLAWMSPKVSTRIAKYTGRPGDRRRWCSPGEIREAEWVVEEDYDDLGPIFDRYRLRVSSRPSAVLLFRDLIRLFIAARCRYQLQAVR
jgi:hypothetical protein